MREPGRLPSGKHRRRRCTSRAAIDVRGRRHVRLSQRHRTVIDQLEQEARQAVLPGRRPAQAAHALERAAQVLRHVPARLDRAAAVPRRRPRRRPAGGREDGHTRRTATCTESDHEKILRTGRWKEAVQGYLAAIAFMRRQIGRLLDALDEPGTGTTRSSSSGATTAGTSARSSTGASSAALGGGHPGARSSGSCPA